MAEQKTKPSDESVESFIEKVEDEKVRNDCFTLIKLMKKVTGSPPKMWGPSIIGFGKYHYKYDSGHEGDSCLAAFSPRKPRLTIYVMPGFADHTYLLARLGKYKASKGCLYVKRLEDIDLSVLKTLIEQSVDFVRKKYPAK